LTIEQAGELVGIAAAAIAVIVWLVRLEAKLKGAVEKITGLEALEQKIIELYVTKDRTDTLYKLWIDSALAKSVSVGAGSLNSPFIVSEEAKEWLGPIREELREFYARFGRQMTDEQLMTEIYRNWGSRLLTEVAIPMDKPHEVAMIVAMETAKGDYAQEQDEHHEEAG